MEDKAHLIDELYPDKRHIVNYLLSVDPDFLSLCEDHEDCVLALRYWSESPLPEASARLNEYRLLIQELRGEIATFISGVDMH